MRNYVVWCSGGDQGNRRMSRHRLRLPQIGCSRSWLWTWLTGALATSAAPADQRSAISLIWKIEAGVFIGLSPRICPSPRNKRPFLALQECLLLRRLDGSWPNRADKAHGFFTRVVSALLPPLGGRASGVNWRETLEGDFDAHSLRDSSPKPSRRSSTACHAKS